MAFGPALAQLAPRDVVPQTPLGGGLTVTLGRRFQGPWGWFLERSSWLCVCGPGRGCAAVRASVCRAGGGQRPRGLRWLHGWVARARRRLACHRPDLAGGASIDTRKRPGRRVPTARDGAAAAASEGRRPALPGRAGVRPGMHPLDTQLWRGPLYYSNYSPVPVPQSRTAQHADNFLFSYGVD